LRTKGGSNIFKTGLEDLKDKHKGETCYIVGKGLSLKSIKKEHFGEGIIITINSAIVQIEKLGLTNQIYAMMKDGDVPDFRPQKAILLVSLHESNNVLEDYSPRYVFNAITLTNTKYRYREFSANCALKVAQLMGCSKIKLLCFDACTMGDIRGINGKNEVYENKRYIEQCQRMCELIDKEKMDVEWIKS